MDSRFEALEAQVDSIQRLVSEIRDGMVGNLDGKPGLLQQQRELRSEVESLKESVEILSGKLADLEKESFITKGKTAGAAGIIGAGVVELIRHFSR